MTDDNCNAYSRDLATPEEVDEILGPCCSPEEAKRRTRRAHETLAETGNDPHPLTVNDETRSRWLFLSIVAWDEDGWPVIVSAERTAPANAIHAAACALSGYPAPEQNYVSVPRGALGIAVRRTT